MFIQTELEILNITKGTRDWVIFYMKAFGTEFQVVRDRTQPMEPLLQSAIEKLGIRDKGEK